MMLLEFLTDLNDCCKFAHTSRKGEVANRSELNRWIKQGSVELDGQIVRDIKHVVSFPIKSFVLFPSSKKKRTTLW